MTWTQFAQTLTTEHQDNIVREAVERLGRLPLAVVRDTEALLKEARQEVHRLLAEKGLTAGPVLVEDMARRAAAQVGGMGFLGALLPPSRNDLTEIALNPDGSVWLLRKGAEHFEPWDYRPTVEEAWRAVEALLAPTGRALNEANPSVNARLPRFHGTGGARVKIVHPVLAPGEGYPAINIRLFEARPILPQDIIAWEMAPDFVMDALCAAVGRKLRVLVIGGTATGKTTFLSALANGGIPADARVVKIEDPEEIWLRHPNVVTLEARSSMPGSQVPPYTLKDGVDDAMRMAPQWLIVGEVRTGDAALALFRAQMSDHPGLSTFHAESPQHAVFRLAVIMFADAQVRMEAAKAIFEQAIDVVVTVGWADGKRRVLAVHEVAGFKGGDVKFRQVYRYGDTSMEPLTRERR